jgi:hypothetical protein
MSLQPESARQYVVNNPRKTGSCLLLIGVLLLYTNVVPPLQAAAEGAATLKISDRMVIIGIVGVVLGLALLIGGPRITRFTHPAPGESRVFTFILAFVMVGLGGAAYYLLKTHIESMGYVFH